MAKKQTKKAAVKEAVVQQEVAEVMEQPITKKEVFKEPAKPKWEIKDRIYFLKGASPVARIMKSSNIYWFDEERGYERELMLTSNQRTVFVDEMEGTKRPDRIIFRDGILQVPKNKVVLQKLLSLYHPDLGVTYYENKPQEDAIQEVDSIELELEAMNAAVGLDVDMAEAVMRAEIGSKVSSMSSKELKRDLLVFAKMNPGLFLDLINDDNIHLRNVGIKATEVGILSLSGDNRTFSWASNQRKLMTVPFDEHPYSALAAWFKTDEGMEVLNSIEKRLN
jgi:hypothetical protein